MDARFSSVHVSTGMDEGVPFLVGIPCHASVAVEFLHSAADVLRLRSFFSCCVQLPEPPPRRVLQMLWAMLFLSIRGTVSEGILYTRQ